MERFAAIARELERLGVRGLSAAPQRQVAGGSIREAYAWRCSLGQCFVKTAAAAARDAFEAEADGLRALAAAEALRVPRVLACGAADGTAFLALEWLDAAAADARSEARLGTGLAALHALTAMRFGYHRDNHLGATPQANAFADDWAEFFAARRLRPQLELLGAGGAGAALAAEGAALLAAVPRLLAGHAPRPSLLHGDLWGGNWFASAAGEAVVFDPAVYYGDREADLAMTRLFGGFGAPFYRAYCAAAPLPPGWERRADLYNLYHVLNHANLFGGGYLAQARALLRRLLA